MTSWPPPCRCDSPPACRAGDGARPRHRDGRPRSPRTTNGSVVPFCGVSRGAAPIACRRRVRPLLRRHRRRRYRHHRHQRHHHRRRRLLRSSFSFNGRSRRSFPFNGRRPSPSSTQCHESIEVKKKPFLIRLNTTQG